MGQGHSTAEAGTGVSNERKDAKKDYYELLDVEQNASPQEIKKAYRKKALELHPDRNFGNVEAATNLFAEIQSAYEVLSDPHERSWYDSHRDAFLGGDAGDEAADYSHNARMTTSADILKLFSKFSPRMDFTDAPHGFYGGLRETFAQLALEEETACRWEGVDSIDYPSFGTRHDGSQVVRDFYAVWGSFSTKKSFAWKDVYRYSEAPDRRVRRLMEKENKRLREAAIREFNEAVRSLVAFAKKRDPRYKIYKDNLSQKREALRQSAASQATKSRAANQARLREHVLQDWARSEDGPKEDEADSEEVETEHIECIVCRKTFKSQNQFHAHERSKKHIKAVKQLRREMRMEEDELNLGNAVIDGREVQTDEDAPVTVTDFHEEKNEAVQHSVSPAASLPDQASHNSMYGLQNMISQEDEADYVPSNVLEQRLGQEDLTAQISELSEKLLATDLDETNPPLKKMGKAKQKRAKKAKVATQNSQLHECTICNASFASRNKLFSHIKSHSQR
ncbi:putative C2H2 finger domain protein [Aspergillus foveolatus]|uniref:putative C2H2 finger domain protein n=1 Tax=Aspergillus foveolatus TaxID=210207 RepID=UPI003CCE5111